MVVIDEIASIAKIAEGEEEAWSACLLSYLSFVLYFSLYLYSYMLCVSKAFVKEEEE